MPVLSEEAYSSVEGTWKNFQIRHIEPKDHEKVFEHIAKHFVRDEPTSKILGYSEDFAKDFIKVVGTMLGDNLSFLAEDIHTGEIAGVRITFHHKTDHSFQNIAIVSPQAKIMAKLYYEAEKLANPKEKLGIDHWAEFYITSTTPKYRNQGLVGEFYKRSIVYLKIIGFRHVLTLTTSPFTRAATDRQGFKELGCLPFNKFFKRVGLDDQLGVEHVACVKALTLN